MILSEFEKEIVRSINDQKVYNIQTFVPILTNSKKVKKGEEAYYKGHIVENTYITDDVKDTIRRVNAYLRLKEKLLSIDLISDYEDLWQTITIIGLINENNNFEEITYLTNIIIAECSKVVLPTEDLQYFIDNNFRTRNEVKEDEEKQKLIEFQSRSYKLSRNIGIIAIVTSIVSAVIAMIFNYMTYTNVRYVKITNPEPSKVEIVNPEVKQLLEKNKPDTKNNNNIKVQLTKK